MRRSNVKEEIKSIKPNFNPPSSKFQGLMNNDQFKFVDTSKQDVIHLLIEEVRNCETVEDKVKLVDKIIEILKI
jgi:hypothetical protein